MRAVTPIPCQAGSARLDGVPEPPPDDGPVLVRAQFLGVCGADLDMFKGDCGWQPPGRPRLILGHESRGRVPEAPAGSGFAPGGLVVGIASRAST